MRIGLYPGTFDPVTLGHLDIIKRATRLVDRLVIGIAENKRKKPLFSIKERVSLMSEECTRLSECTHTDIVVRPFSNLLMHFAQDVGASSIIRGLRAVSDFEYEFQMVGMNRALNHKIEMVFLMADAHHQAIASKLVKEIAFLEGDISKFVTPAVEKTLLQKIGHTA